jgi:uncharacterized membrane protein YwzB
MADLIVLFLFFCLFVAIMWWGWQSILTQH